MKKQLVLLTVFGVFACCSVSQANITNALWYRSNSANLHCTDLPPFANNTLTASTIQYANVGSLVGTIFTDTPDDPTLTLGSSVNNDTSGSWIGYQVNVIMAQTFSFSGTPTVNNPPFGDWFLAGEVAPTLQVTGPHTGDYEGTIYYSAGTLVGIGGELDFSYAISFSSSTDYAFTQEMIPMFAPVPEPGTVALLAMGGLGLALHLRRNSRKSA